MGVVVRFVRWFVCVRMFMIMWIVFLVVVFGSRRCLVWVLSSVWSRWLS